LVLKNEGIQSGLKCPNCNEKMPCGSLAAQLHYAIRNYIRRYNNYVLNCDTCYTSTRQVDIYGRRCMEQDCDGNMTQMVKIINFLFNKPRNYYLNKSNYN